MKVTVFGSCRQQPLSKYYTVSSIQETVTYPHYTKEIIQAIEYCKGTHDMKSSDTSYCFRTGILQKREIRIAAHKVPRLIKNNDFSYSVYNIKHQQYT